jgi:hypothetical protein
MFERTDDSDMTLLDLEQLTLPKPTSTNVEVADKPPELPPIVVEKEWQPPRKKSNLIKRYAKMPGGREVRITPVAGRAIVEAVKFVPNDGTDPVWTFLTRPVPGRPLKREQTNGNGADHD